VWGAGTKWCRSNAARSTRGLPGSRLAVIEKAGHFVDMEQPEALAKLISEFAAGS